MLLPTDLSLTRSAAEICATPAQPLLMVGHHARFTLSHSSADEEVISLMTMTSIYKQPFRRFMTPRMLESSPLNILLHAFCMQSLLSRCATGSQQKGTGIAPRLMLVTIEACVMSLHAQLMLLIWRGIYE